jgi:hypothetical protein
MCRIREVDARETEREGRAIIIVIIIQGRAGVPRSIITMSSLPSQFSVLSSS